MNPFSYLLHTLREPEPEEILWALDDVSFEIEYGEVVGLIGSNGAGKSTLLKILSRITEPSRGRALISGRVASLLEVGTGFHPELTGRENVYLSGTIMGMGRAEIDRKFDEIVAFAEVERFLDTPVKRYSSGMYVRLAFAVAAHLEAEVLLVDEVLAVGDMAFQRKCLGKMGDVSQQGRTILFVSHNMVAVQNLCQRAIWLQQGRVAEDGSVREVMSAYLAEAFSTRTERSWPEITEAPGTDKVRLSRVSIRPENGSPADRISLSTPLIVEVDYWNFALGARLYVVMEVFNDQQILAFASGSSESDPMTRDNPLPVGMLRSTCRIPGNFLNAGRHRLVMQIKVNGRKPLFRWDDALMFEVLDLEERSGAWYGKVPGAVRPRLEWKTEILTADLEETESAPYQAT